MAGENKSEKATARRKQRARDRGQVARSHDLVSALSLLAVTGIIAVESKSWVAGWRGFLTRLLDSASHPQGGLNIAVFSWTVILVAQCVGPVLVLGLAVSVCSASAQGGFVFAPEAFTPNFGRLNPATNLGRIFSIAGLSRLLRSLVPCTAIGFIAYDLIQRELPEIVRVARLGSNALLVRIASLWLELSWKCGLVLLAWSAADYGFQRWSYERGLRMTKQEVKEEAKDTDGNPATRSRRRGLRRALLKKLIAKDIARATAVITNPTHYAVAIEYRPESMAAPVVVAKGRNLLADRIRKLANWYEIPMIENPPLARALYRSTEVGQVIPRQLYAAVAEILAFLYRKQNRLRLTPVTGGSGK